MLAIEVGSQHNFLQIKWDRLCIVFCGLLAGFCAMIKYQPLRSSEVQRHFLLFTCEVLLPGFWMLLFHQFQWKTATSQRRLRLPSWCYQNTFQVVVVKVQGLQFWPNFCDVVLDTRKWKLKKGGFWWLISSIQANKNTTFLKVFWCYLTSGI